MDKDTTSIGGIRNPMQPEKQLFAITVLLDVAGFLLSFLISPLFAGCFLLYILFSRLYSYRKIRLKKYPIAGFFTVILNQGALVFFMIYEGVNKAAGVSFPWQGCLAASFLIGGFYPITQVYQHREDAKDNVTSISMKLGTRGTFIFCGIMYAISFSLLFLYYMQHNQFQSFLILQCFFIPVIFFFFKWLIQVWKDESQANYKKTMRMNLIAATCTNLAFITLIIIKQIG